MARQITDPHPPIRRLREKHQDGVLMERQSLGLVEVLVEDSGHHHQRSHQ
jgi:hypothetical protein